MNLFLKLHLQTFNNKYINTFMNYLTDRKKNAFLIHVFIFFSVFFNRGNHSSHKQTMK